MSSARFHALRKNHGLVQRSLTNPKPSARSTSRRSESYMERLPPELIMKILSYLDAGSLFCISFVNKSFNEHANDNATWYHLYSHRRANAVTSGPVQHLTDGLDAASVQEKPKGFWRRRFFRDLSGPHKDWRKELRVVHPYTGLPRRTAQLLRTLCIQWEITVRGVRGRENRTTHTQVYFSQASVTVSWTSGNWPTLHTPTTLDVHGVMPVPINCPLAYRPGRRSLLNTAVLSKGVGTPCGSDGLVRLLYIENGLTLGVWKDQQEVAFVLLNLHHHRLVQRNLLGSSTMYEPGRAAARFDDLDPEYGLHGYSVHTELHNTETSITSARFTQLHCRRDQIDGGYVLLRVLQKENRSSHVPLCGNISLPWRTEALQGCIQNCCILTLTLFDEAQAPFWCVSAPVAVSKSNPAEVLYDRAGESFSIRYQDAEGRLEIVLEEEEGEEEEAPEGRRHVMVQFDIFIPVSKLNSHFGRNY